MHWLSSYCTATGNIYFEVDMDVLADVLSVARYGNSSLCYSELFYPWAVEFKPDQLAAFHYVSRGHCWFVSNSQDKPIQLAKGDLILITQRAKHVLANPASTKPKRYIEVARPISEAKTIQSNSTVLICGGYYFDSDAVYPFLSLLPDLIFLPAGLVQANSDIKNIIELLLKEQRNNAPGCGAVITRLMDVLFIYIVRAWQSEQAADFPGWLGALADGKIGRTLAMIHQNPSKRWTVEILANEARMSRAAFAKRFSELVGEAPLTYIRRWRMDLAARYLRSTNETISGIANKVGYDSDTTFSKTFRLSRGLSPGQYRVQNKPQLAEQSEMD